MNMFNLPSGTVTFLFTDIESSTRLWQEHPDRMKSNLARHDELLRQSIEHNDGHVFKTVGDAFCAVFSTAFQGIKAAIESQRLIAQIDWGECVIKVRMGLHTGDADEHDNDYFGNTVNRVARIMSAGHGGQILLSLATAVLVRDHLPQDTSLRDLGARRLKDLIRPEQIFQVVMPDLPESFPPLKTLDVHPHNLPVQLTSFIGREREMGEIKKLLAGTHLLTLTGIGGTGKTRLALQISADLIDEFPDGIFLVELAPLRDPALVEETVASVLGVRGKPDCSISDLLGKYVQEKYLLLLLDNCEYVVEACSRLADLLLRSAPKLKIMSTSRIHLNLTGEINYPVPPLALPDLGQSASPLALTQYEAVRLFIDRATSVQPAFRVTNENAPAVAQICTHLDGIPLAIELAAARTRLLSPKQIAARLEDRFNLLTGGSRTVLPHHQTLQAALDWSYDLLGKEEQTLFNRLAVFSGSFSLEAVDAICVDKSISGTSVPRNKSSKALDLLGVLVNDSLVNVQEKNGECRFILLETVYQYALDKLQSSNELSAIQDRHLDYYMKFADRGHPYISRGQREWVERFEADYDNLRTAIEYAITYHLESAVQLEKPLSWFCDCTYRMRESYNWAMRILALTETCPIGRMRAWVLVLAGDRASIWMGEYKRARALIDAGFEMGRKINDEDLMKIALLCLAQMHYIQSDWARMREFAEQLLSISQDLRDKFYTAWSFFLVGESIFRNGDNDQGSMYLERSLDLSRQDDHPNITAFALCSLARISQLRGDIARVKALLLECVQIRRQMGARWMLAVDLVNLGRVFLRESNFIQAGKSFDESLDIFRELKMVRGEIYCVTGFAGVAGIIGQNERAARLFGAAEAAAEKVGIKMDDSNHQTWDLFMMAVVDDFDHQTFDPIIAAIRERLGETDFNAAWAEGRKLRLEQAIENAPQ